MRYQPLCRFFAIAALISLLMATFCFGQTSTPGASLPANTASLDRLWTGPGEAQVFNFPALSLHPTKRVQASPDSARQLLRWSAQIVFAPDKAAEKQFLYVYGYNACNPDTLTANEDTGGNHLLGFLPARIAGDISRGEKPRVKLQLWEPQKMNGSIDNPESARLLCSQLQKEHVMLVFDHELRHVDYLYRLIAKELQDD
jgi:hypothetical protein